MLWLACLLMGLAWPVLSASVDDGHLAIIRPSPDFRLTEAATGQPLALSDLRGRVVLVSFVYTRCTGTCPATTLALTRVEKALRDAGLWDDRLAFVSITLDPAHDSASVLQDYAAVYKADPKRWHFLTGPVGDVTRVLDQWDMWARIGPSGVLDHPSRVFLVDPQGRQREIYNLSFLKPEAVVGDVRSLLDDVRSTAEGPSHP